MTLSIALFICIIDMLQPRPLMSWGRQEVLKVDEIKYSIKVLARGANVCDMAIRLTPCA